MKSQAKLFIKILSLSIVLSSFMFGLYAQNKYFDILALNTNTSKLKTSPKTNNPPDLKLVTILDLNVVEKPRTLEDWMLDSKSWEIVKKFEWDKEPIEEPKEIEDWMTKFKINNTCCIDIYSDFIEKEWMKNHNFFIL